MILTGKNSSLIFIQLEYHPMLAKVTTRLCNKILTGLYTGRNVLALNLEIVI
jgi:hypothetical protein